MQVFNMTTQETAELKLTVNGVDSAADLIQIATNDEFEYNTEKRLYQADDATIRWWADKLDEYQAMYRLINTKNQKYPKEVQTVLEEYEGIEFNDYPQYVMAALNNIGKPSDSE